MEATSSRKPLLSIRQPPWDTHTWKRSIFFDLFCQSSWFPSGSQIKLGDRVYDRIYKIPCDADGSALISLPTTSSGRFSTSPFPNRPIWKSLTQCCSREEMEDQENYFPSFFNKLCSRHALSLARSLSLSLFTSEKKILVKLKTTTHSTREFRQPIFLKSLMARRLPARWKLIRFSRLKRRILQTNFSLISIICSQGPLRGLRVKKQNDSTGAVLAIARRISTRTHYSSSSVFAACNHGNILMNTWSLVRLSLLFPKLLSSWSRFSLSQFMFFCACMCAVWYKKFGKRNEKKSAKVCKLLHTTRDTRKKFKFILQIMQKQRKIIRKHTSLPANW